MNRKKVSNLFLAGVKAFALLTSTFALVMPIAASAQDAAVVSQLPSIKSARASQSLLQDIVRTGDRLVAVGDRGHIIYSDDNGKTWQQADVPTRAMLNAVFFPTHDAGWAVGHDGLILNTKDAGKTWAIQLDGLKFTRKRMADSIPVLEAKLKKMSADKAAAEEHISEAQDNGEEDLSRYEDLVAELDDKVATAETDLEDAKAALSGNTVANPLMDVWFRDENAGFAVGAFGDFLETKDGGASWESVADRLGNDEKSHLNAITGQGNLMYIVGEGGLIYRSEDGGSSWVKLPSPDPENGSFFAVTMMEQGNQILVSGLRGAIYRSLDRGNTWKQVPEDLHKNINTTYPAGGDMVLAVGNDGAFLRSRDGGRTFESRVQKNRLTLSSVVVAADGSYVLVGAGGVQVISPDSI